MPEMLDNRWLTATRGYSVRSIAGQPSQVAGATALRECARDYKNIDLATYSGIRLPSSTQHGQWPICFERHHAMSDRLGVVFYPRYCFHLAPTAKGWCFLRVKDLFTLEQPDGFEGEGFHFHRNLPIKWVRIVGVIVAIDHFAGLRAMTIDDSSGACIEVIASSAIPTSGSDGIEPAEAVAGPPAQPKAPYDYVDVGSVVDVKGALTTFRDVKQLRVEKMAAIRGTAEEMRLWAKRSAFRTDVLEKPWVVPDKTLRKCRREAERSEAEMERKKQRLKAAAYVRKGDETNRRQGAVEERRSKPSKDGVEVLKALANSEGGYNALGL